MKILNTHVIMFETYNNEKPNLVQYPMHFPTSGLAALQDSLLLDEDVWYCQITTEDSLDIFDVKRIMGSEIFDRVLNKNATIVIDLSFEPFLNCIDSIYKNIVIKHGAPPSQIIFLSALYDADVYNINAAAKYNCDPIRTFYFSALEYMARDYRDAIPNTLAIKSYDKKFLNLNRRWRPHRPLLTLLLYHRNLLDKGFVSFGPCEGWQDNWEYQMPGLKVRSLDNPEMLEAIHQSEDTIKHLPPLYLDTDELHINRAQLTSSTNKYYEDSYFSLISETTFYHKDEIRNSRFITEKTYKAIVLNHPFVLVTIPKSLEALKELGYKTFSPWIDESYDDEIDDNKRLMLIVKETERLCNLSEKELEEFLIATKEICAYNYNIFKNRKVFVYKK